MKLLANENFPFASVKYLAGKGFDIKAIAVDSASITDREVMDIAINEQRTILTFDKDYGELIFRHHYKPEMGVVYLRLDNYSSEEPGIIIEQLINNATFNFSRKLTVVSLESIRQRTY